MSTQNSIVATQGEGQPRMLPAPSPHGGEGWGEGVTQYREIGPPSPPPSPLRGEVVPPCRDGRLWSPTKSASTSTRLIARLICVLALTCTATLARAQGDAARGEKYFVDCASCHSLT